jgi:predicted nucleotidyltransferase
MNRDQALEKSRHVEPLLRSLGVGGASLFGSVARGREGEFSDVDIAVRPAPGATIDALTLLSLYGVFGDEFGHDARLDVVVLPARRADLAAAIERDGVLAFS